MKLFLCGGGAGEQTREARRRLNGVIDHACPCLYIPLAMEPDCYEGCQTWIAGELQDVDVPAIDMVRSADALAAQRLADYSFVFIGGGNTFRLLHVLRASGTLALLEAYLAQGGVVFGGSAGAILFGASLDVCALDDANDVGLTDMRGLDCLGGASLLCHYPNPTCEADARTQQLLALSYHHRIIALPEEVTLYTDGRRLEPISDRPYFRFENGRITAQSAAGSI